MSACVHVTCLCYTKGLYANRRTIKTTPIVVYKFRLLVVTLFGALIKLGRG